MRAVRVLVAILFAGILAALPLRPAGAVDAPPVPPSSSLPPLPPPPVHGCMDRFEQRVTILQGQAIRLAFALRAVRAQDGDALLRARLCYGTNGLVYVLTLLSRTGKVTNVLVDARTGAVVKGR